MGLHLPFLLLYFFFSPFPPFLSFFLPPFCLRTLANPSKKPASTPPPTALPSSPQFTSTALPPLLSDRRCQFGLEYLPKFSRVFLFILFNFCHTTRTFVSADWILCWWKFELFPAIVGLDSMEVGNDSARKGSDNCLVGSLLFLLSSSIVFVIRLSVSSSSFLFLSFYLMVAESEKQGGVANCVFFVLTVG